jgi:hypothetical protein
MDQWAERTGSAPLPPDPTPRKLKIQPHAAPMVIDADADEDLEDDADDSGFEKDVFEDDSEAFDADLDATADEDR